MLECYAKIEEIDKEIVETLKTFVELPPESFSSSTSDNRHRVAYLKSVLSVLKDVPSAFKRLLRDGYQAINKETLNPVLLFQLHTLVTRLDNKINKEILPRLEAIEGSSND